MRGGKDEEKVMSPMFPRLHVNDTDRGGGPRAPPRNKMALYEQLSIPSQWFGPGSSASVLHLPPSNGATLVPSTSSSTSTHGTGGRERTPFTPFCNSPATSQSAGKLHSFSSMGANLNGPIPSTHAFTKPIDCQSSDATRPFQSILKCHSFQPPKFSNFRNSSHKKHGGEDVVNVTVPTFAQSSTASHCAASQCGKDQFPIFRMSSLMQLHAAEKHMKLYGIADLNSRQHVTNQTGESTPIERSVSVLVDPSPSLSAKDKSSSGLLEKHRSLLDAISKRHGTDAHLRDETKATLLEDSPKQAPKMTGETCSRPSSEGNKNGSECPEDEVCGSVLAGEADEDDEISDSSMADSVPVLDISPDDVVGLMGEKHFWKTRRAIVNQQRVFAVQVFELHRLITVQRMIAASPHLLFQDNLNFPKSSLKGPVMKNLPSEQDKPRNGSQNPNPETESVFETPFPNLPFPFAANSTSKGLVSIHAPYSPNQPTPPNAKPSSSPWCFHPPPGNQWLIPVMSPSEGFVYKPLMAPGFGTYEAVTNGDLLNKSGNYGTVLASQAYFPPYAMPVMNQSVSGSAVEHEKLTNVEVNNMSSQMSRAVCFRAGKQDWKESEVQGSTGSSSSEAQALPLFPLASDLNSQPPPRTCEQTRAKVIKVVPHNPRSASESAARIFQFIQEERKQFD